MPSCIRCREKLSIPDANYCGNCSLPILNELSEKEVRERAREELSGFLDGFDVRTLRDVMEGDQREPAEEYQWYLEEGLKKTFSDIAFLQASDWFDKDPITGLFFHKELFEESEPSDEVMNDVVLWARVSAFMYEAFQPAGIELSVKMGALLAGEIDSLEDVELSISVGSTEGGEDSDITGPAS